MYTEHKLATVVFADITGYTMLMQKDEQAALDLLSIFKVALEQHVETNHGRIIQFYGDGCLMTFSSSTQALVCCMALQEYFRIRCIPFRIGMHLGDIVFRDRNVFGDAVNIASRIESMGVPGAILLSKSLQDQVKNKKEFQLFSLGLHHFKNVNEPIELFALSNPGFPIPKSTEMHGKLESDLSVHNDRKSLNLKHLLKMGIAIIPLGFLLFLIFNEPKSKYVICTISILPFSVSEAQSQKEILSLRAGIYEHLIKNLSVSDSLNIIPQQTINSNLFTAPKLNLTTGDNSPRFLLSGNIKQKGDNVQIDVQLLDSYSVSNSWAQTYNKVLSERNTDEIELVLARQIVSDIIPLTRLVPQEPPKRWIDISPSNWIKFFKSLANGVSTKN